MTEYDEMNELKIKADRLGVQYHPSIGAATLRKRIAEAMEPKEEKKPKVKDTVEQKNAKLRREANRLVRVRISCMNPNKNKWKGEIFSVSNKIIGCVRKYIPFHADDGYHVPTVLLTLLENKKYLETYTATLANGREVPRKRLIKEFAIEKLPPLTEKELKVIAERQKANGTI